MNEPSWMVELLAQAGGLGLFAVLVYREVVAIRQVLTEAGAAQLAQIDAFTQAVRSNGEGLAVLLERTREKGTE